MKFKPESIYKIVGILLFIYMLVLLGRTSYLNYKINSQITNLKNNIDELESSNKELTADLEYYKTPQYKEKVARQRLGLKKGNEEVLVMVPEENKEKEKEENRTPNYLKWWNLIRG